MKTHVAYDTRSGQIISVHEGSTDAVYAQERAHQRSKIAREHLGAIEINSDAMQSGQLYRVDPVRKTLVAVAAGEKGSAFGGSGGKL